MATETKNTQKTEEQEQGAQRKLPKGRRYVGSKETFTYVLFDIAQSFNLDNKKTYYLTDVLVISYWWQAIISVVVSIWDIINDLFLAAIVDRTNTRFGKFKPYLIIYAIPGTAMAVIYWLLPIMFPETSGVYMPKIITYFILQMVMNLATSLYNIAKTGIIATITPDVLDRTRLINQANLFSSLVENLPRQLCTIFIDLVNHGKMKVKMTSLFVYMGAGTALCAGILALFFSFKVKERVLQSVEKPSFKNAFGSIFKSRPLMLLMLSDFLGQFTVSANVSLYYINVMNLSSAELIVGVPGMFVTYASYAYVDKLRERFSTKVLWTVGSHWGDFLNILVYLFGQINKNYKKTWVMLFAFMARETLWNFVYAMRKVVPEEIRNESIDYGEWKNGYRTEAMAGVVKGLAQKLVATFTGGFSSVLLGLIGYKQGLKPGQQTAKTEKLLFMMVTLLPGATGMIGIIPKLFYNIDAETKDRMYKELAIRRAETAKAVNELANQEEAQNSEA
ncbi:MAG: MFS transporter [Ruminococcus sp.]|nr:MFS transporter [Candidatus Copronaster equi]